jgi:tRNA G26 N,N-dimethylase Trm1
MKYSEFLNNELCKKFNINEKTADKIIKVFLFEPYEFSLQGIKRSCIDNNFYSEEVQKIIKKAGEK